MGKYPQVVNRYFLVTKCNVVAKLPTGLDRPCALVLFPSFRGTRYLGQRIHFLAAYNQIKLRVQQLQHASIQPGVN